MRNAACANNYLKAQRKCKLRRVNRGEHKAETKDIFHLQALNIYTYELQKQDFGTLPWHIQVGVTPIKRLSIPLLQRVGTWDNRLNAMTMVSFMPRNHDHETEKICCNPMILLDLFVAGLYTICERRVVTSWVSWLWGCGDRGKCL
jgi:hypothetical protein